MVYNNYYQCYFNKDPSHVFRKDIYDKWEVHFTSVESREIKSLKEETLNSCELMYDAFKSHTPTLNLLFSGGMDSECLLRCFNQLGIPVNPIIIVHEYFPNAPEIRNAFKVCDQLSITPTVFNLNLHELYESGVFHEMGKKFQTARIGQLELLYVMDKIQEPSISADDIQMTFISSGENLLKPNETEFQEWYYEVREDEDGLYDRYAALTGIPNIADTFKYTPQNWAALVMAPHIQDIVFLPKGKASAYSTKNKMMSKEFSVLNRDKTNVFANGYHRGISNRLKEELMPFVLPPARVRIEYKTLLQKLGVNCEF